MINFGRLGKDPGTRVLAVQDITRACRDQGCFQVSACLLARCTSLFTDRDSELQLRWPLYESAKGKAAKHARACHAELTWPMA